MNVFRLEPLLPSIEEPQRTDEFCLPDTPTEICPSRSARSRPVVDRRIKTHERAQKWMYALLLYNTCVAPMSSYCADSIFQYGMDVAKYNVVSLFFKFLREVMV